MCTHKAAKRIKGLPTHCWMCIAWFIQYGILTKWLLIICQLLIFSGTNQVHSFSKIISSSYGWNNWSESLLNSKNTLPSEWVSNVNPICLYIHSAYVHSCKILWSVHISSSWHTAHAHGRGAYAIILPIILWSCNCMLVIYHDDWNVGWLRWQWNPYNIGGFADGRGYLQRQR